MNRVWLLGFVMLGACISEATAPEAGGGMIGAGCTSPEPGDRTSC
jgi:hypothetical protein